MVSRKTAQRVGRATIAVGTREEDTDDICRFCRGGDSGWRYRYIGICGLSTSGALQGREMYFIEEPRAKIARIEKWV